MTFVTISYGENKRLLFNPDCKTGLFLENIKKRCQCPNEMEIELSDEFGNLKNITTLPSSYAKQVLNIARESLVLIEVKRNASDDITSSSSDTDDVSYNPLLVSGDIVNSKFKARLGNRNPDSSRPESRMKRSRDKREKTRRSNEMTSSERRDDSTTSPVMKRNLGNKAKGNQNRASKSKKK